MPPLKHQNKYVTDLKEKAETFNSFFAEQCSLMNNSSKLPSTFLKGTDKFIPSIAFSSSDITRIIQDLDPNKVHGHDMISIPMLEIWGESISKPLEIILNSCIEKGQFPNGWKKATVVPVHKKGHKQVLRNYRPVSLLPICGKIFERLIYNNLYEFFIKSDLISSNQSGFKQGDSCIYQLLPITHESYQSFDNGFEVRGIFLDINKAFDKVWHKSLIFELKQNVVTGDLLNILIDFLKVRKQRVVLNGQYSEWPNISAGVPQGSILEPLLFLIYINDWSVNLSSNPKLSADDTSLFPVLHNINQSGINLNDDLEKISNWAFQWKMSFNPDINIQAQEVIFSRRLQKSNHPSLTFNGTSVTQ